MSEVPQTSQRLPPGGTEEHLTPNQRAWRRFRGNRLAVAGGWVLLLFLVGVLLLPLVQSSPLAAWLPISLTHEGVEVSAAQFAPPSRVHWCGTDVHGRDLLARMVYGARISILVGLFGASVSLIIGVLWGAFAGYVGGRWDSLMMRLVDVLYSLPSIVFVIVLIATLDGFLKSWSSPLVVQADLMDEGGLVARIQNDRSPALDHVRQRMDPVFLAGIAARAEGTAGSERAKRLATELSRVINGESLYAAEPFRNIALRRRTRDLLGGEGGMGGVPLLNRCLLEDLFPRELRRHDRWYVRVLSTVFSPKLGASTQMIYLFIGLGAVSWLTMARIVRGEVLSLRTRAFVEASRALGAGHVRVVLRHILPNVTGIIIVYLTLTVPSIVLYESFLSYLGLGIQPPQASLGSLIAEGANQLNPLRVYWWMIVFPAATLATVLLALNFVGDGLRDAFDPRASER